MDEHREPMLELAAAVADGRAVDWDAAIAKGNPAQTASIRGLELIERIATTCRSFEPAFPATTEAALTHSAGRAAGADDPIPSTWGPLERLELVGGGTFGEVFRAWDPRLQRTVALKLLRRTAESKPDVAERVLQEGRLLARVRHPNVAVVYAVEEHAGRVGTWMEFVEGSTLDSIVKSRGPFGPHEAAVVGVELCRALAAVHGAGLLHRDVKSQNVMREAGGRIVLMDFGAGLDIEADLGNEGISGTPLYMAPEILDGERASVESDLYAVGVLLFFLATGSYPVFAETLSGLRRAHAAGDRRRLRDLRPDVPAAFASVVQTATASRSEDRFRTAGALEEALSATLKERGASPITAARSMATASATRHRFRVGWLQAALAAVMLIGVLAVLMPRWLETSDSSHGLQTGPSDRSEAESPRSGSANPADAGHPPPRAPAFSHVKDVGTNLKRETRALPPGPIAKPPETAAIDPARVPTGKLDAHVTLFRDRAGSREPLHDGAQVSVGDTISLELDSPEPVHVYIVHEDDRHDSVVLFPIPGVVPSNPVPAGPQRLPGTMNGMAKDWEVDSAGGHERILVLLSRKAIEDLDAALVAARHPTAGPHGTTPDTPSDGEQRTRGMGRLAERPETGGSENVFALAKTLATRPSADHEVWMRQFELENKGR